MAANCTYSFTAPDGQPVVLTGQAAIKAWLVAGGLEYLRGAANDARASRERWSKPGGPAVVYDGPRRDGVSMLAGGYHPQQRVAWIEAVQVDGDRRRSGIGAGAVSDFEAWASSMGAVRIRAEATPSSLRFWEALGYKVAGQAFSNNRTPIEKNVARASRARDITDTPEFKKWFGDSKVVDAEGRPLVVYHGTAKSFDKFSLNAGRNTDMPGDAQGFYFTKFAEDAAAYATDDDGDVADGANLMPVFLSIEKPFVVERGDIKNHPAYISRERRAKLEADGFDGIMYGNGTEYVVFRPEQIKSATGNRGTFDPADPDITRSAERDINSFRKEMLARVDANIAMAKMRGAAHDWAFNVGDQLLSTKTGKVYTLVGRIFQRVGPLKNNDWQPVYYYEADGGDEKGTFPEKSILESKTLKSLTTPVMRSAERISDEKLERVAGLGLDADAGASLADSSRKSDDARQSAPRNYDVDLTAQQEAEKPAKSWIEKVYAELPRNPLMPRQRMMMFGEDDFAVLELAPSGLNPGGVTIQWIQAYPLRSGNGTKAIRELQRLAAEDGIELDLWPWDKGRVSQANLIKFYKSVGFEPMRRGSKDMIWRPEQEARRSSEREYPRISGFNGLSLRRPTADINATADSAFGGDAYRVLPGVREVPFSDFELQGEEAGIFNTPAQQSRIDDLAAAIKKSGSIEPLFISAPNSGGMFLSEGQHRARALKKLGYSSAPARIIQQDAGGTTRPTIIRSAERGLWYSQLSRAIESVPARLDNQSGVMWAQWLKANAAKMGVKQDEITWSGIEDFLKLKGKAKVSKDEIGAYLADGGVRVDEAVLGDGQSRKSSYGVAEVGEGFSVVDGEELIESGFDTEQEAWDWIERQPDVAGKSKYSQYTLPGGTNYREVLLTLPERASDAKRALLDFQRRMKEKYGGLMWRMKATREEIMENDRLLIADIDSSPTYRSSHWDQKNILAHIRLNDRTDADGRRVLFVDELQSDWAQDGRKKGFKQELDPAEVKRLADQERRADDELDSAKSLLAKYKGDWQAWLEKREKLTRDPRSSAEDQETAATKMREAMANIESQQKVVDDLGAALDKVMREHNEYRRKAEVGLPRAPFIDDTSKWLNLSLKRVIKMAVDEGYDAVAFVNGEQSAERFSLDKQLDSVSWRPSQKDRATITIRPKSGPAQVGLLDTTTGVFPRFESGVFGGERLEDVLGKEMAERVMASPEGSLSGDGLKIEAKGMRAFYDQIVPQAASALVKKMGGEGMATLSIANEDRARRIADAEARQLPDNHLWGVYLTSTNEWLVGDDGTTSNPNIAGAYSERAARSAADAMNRAARELQQRPLLKQPGFAITDKMRQAASGPLPLFSRERGWGDFPDAVIASPLSAQTKDADYVAAKAGDAKAASRLVGRVLPQEAIDKVRQMIGDLKPVVVPVSAEEAAGRNKIPLAAATRLSSALGLDIDVDIVQSTRARRSGADGMARLGLQPEFDGNVQSGRDYLLVDDTLTQGGTLAQLKTYIERGGGRVVGAFALGGKQYSARIAPDAETLARLRDKYGSIEDWWRSELGFGFHGFTQSEARYVLASGLAPEALRDRVAAARSEAGVGRDDARLSRDRAAWTPERIDRLLGNYAYTMDDEKTKAYAGFVSPEDYLRATTPASGIARLESENKPLDEAELRGQVQPIMLIGEPTDAKTWKTTGHEGRHRMMALRDAGVRRVPVVFQVGYGLKREPLSNVFVTAQRWSGGPEAQGGFIVERLTPISYKYAKELKETFGGDGDIRFSRERTETPEFKRWFGDSKVRDADGKPLVVYHGSKRDFSRFEFKTRDFTNTRVVDDASRPGWKSLRGTFNGDGMEMLLARWLPIGGDKVVFDSAQGLEVIELGGKSPESVARSKMNPMRYTSDRIAGGVRAFFFAEDPAYTGFYSIWGEKDSWNRPTTYPVYIRIEKPILPESWPDFEPFYKKATGGDRRQMTLAEAAFKNQRWEAMEGWPGLIQYAKSKGYDGYQLIEGGASVFGSSPVTEVAPGGKKTWAVFSPTQIKSAIGNDGSYDDDDPNILSSAERNWSSPGASKFDDVVYKMQNRQVDLLRVQQAIQETGQQISEDRNTYLREELFHGRAAKRTQDFTKRELEPLTEEMAKRGLTLEELDEYLHARHAPEANRLIAERNPDNPLLQDGGSGLDTALAQQYMSDLTADKKAHLEAVAAMVDKILAKTRQLMVDYELESKDTVQGWGEMFQHYVPLMREDDGDAPQRLGTGQGYSIRGREVKSRTGSTKKVVDILANIAMQRERVIVRGEKNRVGQALVNLARENENKDFWTVDLAPTTPTYDPKKGVVVQRPDPMYKMRPNVVVAKFREADGSVKEHAVIFNEGNARAMRTAAVMKNLEMDRLEGLLGASAVVSRYFAAINTQWNPVFGVVNFIRDFQNVLINLKSTPLDGKQKQIAADAWATTKAIYTNLRTGKTDTAMQKLWDEFQEVGGQTGFRQMFADSQERADDIRSTINPDYWMDSKLGKIFTANGVLKVPVSKAAKAVKAGFQWLTDYNDTLENSMRLAVYKAGKESGMSKEEAASLAKNISVNFNRKGQVAQQAGALYAFFNAASQGTARLGELLFTMEPGQLKTLRLSRVGKRIVAGGVLIGVAQALALAMAGYSEDDPPQFLRERSIIIPTFDGRYVSVPMPLGLHVLPNMGRVATEWAMGGFEKTPERIVGMLGLFADAFNPIGNAGLSMQTIAPTALDPLVALTENRDWQGRPIARESMNPATPGHALARDTATSWAIAISKGVNTLTGGNDYVAGAISPSPDQVDYLIGQLTGGVGREISKVEQTVTATVTGEELPIFKVPLVGRFGGNTASQASEGANFYGNVQRLNELETEIKGLQQDGKIAEAAQLRASRPDAYLIAQANRAERDISKLRKEKSRLVKEGAPREQVRAIEERITARMASLNRAVEALGAAR